MAKGAGFPPSDPQKVLAYVEGAAVLEDWLELAQRSIKTGGTVTFIHRSDRQEELMAGFSSDKMVCHLATALVEGTGASGQAGHYSCAAWGGDGSCDCAKSCVAP